MLMEWFLFLFVYASIGILLLPGVIQFLIQHRITAENYKSENIPIGMGLYLGIMLIVYLLMFKIMITFTPFNTIAKIFEVNILYSYMISLTVIIFLGWLDDTVGDKQIKGFSGHWKKWRYNQIITTGMLKVWITSFMALLMVIETYENIPVSVLRFTVIVLMTNAMNLLDLRPGRTLKVFFMLSISLFIFGTWFHTMGYLIPVLISALIIFQKDLKAKIMLGDTGANYLGFALGFNISISAPIWFQLMILGLLIAVHWIAVRSSITSMIENHKLLYWIDRWGRT